MAKNIDNITSPDNFRDKISTVTDDGSRRWIFPKKPKGKLYNARTWVSIFLLIILFVGPWVNVNGNPLLMLNIVERKFSLFGQIFWPQDFYLFLFAMLIFIVFVIVFTVIFGRVFCGWVCPQTIFMEMVFRKIEYWIEGDWKHQMKLDKQPWNIEKIRKKVLKHGLFFLISVIIANTFLAYIIGSTELIKIQTEPLKNHLAGFSSMIIFSFVFYAVFARFREQVCIAVCPYGRLQGVLLDRNTVVVAYDYKRGENRGKWQGARENRKEVGKGDCIDCFNCVDVCPTGIDIRNGTQLECVNCTACIDACDDVMEKVGLPKGLIRFDSEEGIANQKPFKLTARVYGYIAVLVVLTGVMVALLFSRTEVDTTILRTPGVLFQKTDDGRISNLYNIKIINKTANLPQITLQMAKPKNGEIKLVGNELKFDETGIAQSVFFVILNNNELTGMKTEIEIEVLLNNKTVETIQTSFLGPNN